MKLSIPKISNIYVLSKWFNTFHHENNSIKVITNNHCLEKKRVQSDKISYSQIRFLKKIIIFSLLNLKIFN